MNKHPKTSPPIGTPLLDFAETLKVHQSEICSNHQLVSDLIDQIQGDLSSIQNAYQSISPNVEGRWFIKATYDAAQSAIRVQCEELNTYIHDALGTKELHSPDLKIKDLIKSLSALARLLEGAAQDSSHLSTAVATFKPEITPLEKPDNLDDIIAGFML